MELKQKCCSICKSSSLKTSSTQLFRFPDCRKNPVLYRKWCNTFNIDPKEEKATKPLVCCLHFNPKHISEEGLLSSHASPWRKHVTANKYKTRTSKNRNKKQAMHEKTSLSEKSKLPTGNNSNNNLREDDFPQEELEYEFIDEAEIKAEVEDEGLEIKEEPYEEVTIEEARFADQQVLQNHPPSAPVWAQQAQEKSPASPQASTKISPPPNEETDEEFLESLLPDILMMNENQKEIFYKVMKLKYLKDFKPF